MIKYSFRILITYFLLEEMLSSRHVHDVDNEIMYYYVCCNLFPSKAELNVKFLFGFLLETDDAETAQW